MRQPNQSVSWGRRLVCEPFQHLTASLGSITDTLTLTEKYVYANDFKVRLRELTDFAKD
jgi:hypothetical protein